MDEAGGQIARFDVALGNLSKVQELAPRAEQQIQALNALADQIDEVELLFDFSGDADRRRGG
jgi:hypothetical protein